MAQILNSERSGHPELRERAERAGRRLTMPGGRDTLGFALPYSGAIVTSPRCEPPRANGV